MVGNEKLAMYWDDFWIARHSLSSSICLDH